MATKEIMISLMLMSIFILIACICFNSGFDVPDELDDFLTESVLEPPFDLLDDS